MTDQENYKTDEELITEAEMSPCVGVCKSDETTGWCIGCGRTDAEINDWQSIDNTKRLGLEQELPNRVQQMIERRRAERGGSNRRSRRVSPNIS